VVAAQAAGAGRARPIKATAATFAVGLLMVVRMIVRVVMIVCVVMIVRMIVRVVMIVRGIRQGPVLFFSYGVGEPRGFIGQRKERVALGTGKPAAVLFAGKKRGETAGQQQTEEDSNWYDGHAWNA